MIPAFLGIENPKKMPYAEMWLGTHKGAPSKAVFDEKTVSLAEITGELPFLLKLLGVKNPLSIQVHPNKRQAAEGFALEEKTGFDIRSPQRCYKDPNHKPEIICALSPFTLMAGFRGFPDIIKNLEEFAKLLPQLKEIVSPLCSALKSGLLAAFFRILFNLSDFEREYIGSLILQIDPGSKQEADRVISKEQWNLMKQFAFMYPKDPAIISPLYLNLITLMPGQAVYIPAGVLHAYISGFGVELMASSDNVLRGGLTPKYVDIPKLSSILSYNPYIPNVLSPDSSSCFFYNTPGEEFQLVYINGGEMVFPGKGPAVCIVTEGELLADGIKFKKGESFLIPADAQSAALKGSYSLFAAITADKS